MLLQMAGTPSFLWLNNIWLYVCLCICTYILHFLYPLICQWCSARFHILAIVGNAAIWTWQCRCLFEAVTQGLEFLSGKLFHAEGAQLGRGGTILSLNSPFHSSGFLCCKPLIPVFGVFIPCFAWLPDYPFQPWWMIFTDAWFQPHGRHSGQLSSKHAVLTHRVLSCFCALVRAFPLSSTFLAIHLINIYYIVTVCYLLDIHRWSSKCASRRELLLCVIRT